MMFAYSFLAMTAYNILKPITRSKFISGLGADNLPYVQLAAGLLIGVLMERYSALAGRVPRRFVVPATLGSMAVVLVGFWVLFQTAGEWVSVAFYLLGLILGLLLISQFWTLANDIYDPRQAKRVFGLIGGGSSLGGMTGAGLTALMVTRIGTLNLLLCSAAILVLCSLLVALIIRRERGAARSGPGVPEEEGVSGKEALRLLRESRHLQVIALVIGFAAVGAGLIEQQLNMAAEAFKGRSATDSLTAFLAQVTLYLSAIGFLIQIGLTSRIHRRLGVGFALLVLPTSLGVTGVVMLLNAVLWAPALARILDTSLRYTLDKTTREVLFLPLPTEIKYRAKPFVDVSVDRFAKGVSALLALVLIKPWGLGLNWQQISYASLAVTGLWVFTALRARREYQAAFRRSIEKRTIETGAVRPELADLTTVEALVEELAHPDEERVLYAIELLESFDKRHLVTPLLLHHDSERVRVRALLALEAARPELRERWAPAVERLLRDGSVEVRVAAVQALAAIRGERSAELMRAHLEDRDPRVATTAALTLAGSSREEDVVAAERALQRLAADTREGASEGRRQVAAALGRLRDGRFRPLLVPLMFDADLSVAREAVESAGRPGEADELLLPPLVSLLRRRPLRATVRGVLAGRGEGALDVLAYFLGEGTEDIEVRRQIPATLARIPSPRSVELLLASLGDPDEPLRDQAIDALQGLRRSDESLALARAPVEECALAEARRYFRCLSLRQNVLREDVRGSLLDRTLAERLKRAVDRTWRLIGLVYPPRDVAAARRGIEGDARARARAAEYLDNLLGGALRRFIVPLLEDLPPDEKVRKGNALLKTRERDLEDTLAQLIHDEDQLLSAAAIQRVEEKGLWALADDLEHVLSHRDSRDLHAFEAASWALAARRISPEARRTRWREALPAAEVAHRLLQVPLLRFAPVEALFRLASVGRTHRPEGGRVLAQEDASPSEVQFLIEGDAVTRQDPLPPRQRAAPLAVGLEQVLCGGRLSETTRAREGAVCLAVAAQELLALLAEDAGLLRALLRGMLGDGPVPGEARVLRARPESPRSAEPAPSRTLEQIRLLEGSPLFAKATPDELLRLAEIAREEPLAQGVVLFEASDPAALHILEDGEVTLEAEAGPSVLAQAGDTLGVRETLAGARGEPARVTVPGRALRFEGDALLELLAEDTDLLQAIFSVLREVEGPA
jgi:HEAT repeat protein/CRP-like cAMP-binding protein/MFS family permease